MKFFTECLAVGAGGFFGSVFRYLLSKADTLTQGMLPFHTLIANMTGALLIGLFIGYEQYNSQVHSHIKLLFQVGLCGGFTTFSTFALESFNFLEKGQWLTSFIYISSSIILCIAFVFIGKYIIFRLNA